MILKEKESLTIQNNELKINRLIFICGIGSKYKKFNENFFLHNLNLLKILVTNCT